MSSVVEPEPTQAAPKRPVLFHQFMTPIQRQGSAAYKRELARLLKESPGKWVAFRGDEQIALADTVQDLIKQVEALGLPRNEVNVCGIKPLLPPIDLRLFRGRMGRY